MIEGLTTNHNPNTTRTRKRNMTQAHADDSLVVRVGARIRKLRSEQGVGLRDFGKRAGVHPFHVMAIELGQLATSTKTLQRIATTLGVTPADLLNHGADNDELGQLYELLRKHPEKVRQTFETTNVLVVITSKRISR